MKTLRWVMLLCLLTMAVIALPAAAQDSNPFGLSEADWALFQAAQNPGEGDLAYTYTSTLSLSDGSSNLSWDVSGSGLVGPGGFSLDNTGTVDLGMGSSTPAPLNLRLNNDGVFFSIDNEQWIGGTAEELTELVTSFGGAMLPGGMTGSTGGTGDLSDLMAQPGAMEAMMAASSLDPSTFTTITREADVNGLANFQTVVNIGSLVEQPEIQQAIGAALEGQTGGSAADMSAAVDQLVQGLSGSTITLNQYVNPDTQRIENAALVITLNIPSTDGSTGALTFNLTLDVTLSDAAGQTVDTPPAANVMPFSEALGALMGGMSGMSGS